MSEKQDTFFSALDNALAHGENAKSALISACEVYAEIYWACNEQPRSTPSSTPSSPPSTSPSH